MEENVGESPAEKQERPFSGPTPRLKSDSDKFICLVCKHEFARYFSLKRHVHRKHSENFEDFVASTKKFYQFRCTVCSKQFSQKASFNYHLKKNHSISGQVNIKLHKCPVCVNEFSKSDIYNHFETVHDIKVERENFKFDSYDEFLSWKTLMEKDTKSFYSKVNSKGRKDMKRHYFYCHRSGNYKPRGEGIREPRKLVSTKINAFCPSMLKVQESGSGCTVLFLKTHIGHQDEHLYLTDTDRRDVASKLAQKVSFDTILDDIRCSISNEDRQRLYLLSQKELNNIKTTFSRGSDETNHLNEADIVNGWVKEVEDDETSSIVFHKPLECLIEDYWDLNADDFVLIIMTESQEGILKKFGSDCVCIDSTSVLNRFGFQLTTLLVLDDLRQGFPCAFVISNRTDECILKLFFKEIRKKIGVLNSKVFMSSMTDFYYDAWCQVMPAVRNRIYCAWHVDSDWRANLKRIKSKEQQVEVYKMLRILLVERDTSAFRMMLEKACVKLKNNEETEEFAAYFSERYLENIKSWAYCYRLNAGVNCNMHVERMRNTLNYIYLQGKAAKRLDRAMQAIMKIVGDRLTILSECKISEKKLNRLRQRHQTSLGMNSEILINTDKGEWLVSAIHADDMHVIREDKIDCTCQLVCDLCKACIHAYICSCPDSSIKCNMCKHIHFLCTHRVVMDTNIEDLTFDIANADTKTDLQDGVIACDIVDRKESMKREMCEMIETASPEELNCIADSISALKLKLSTLLFGSKNKLCRDQPSASVPPGKKIEPQHQSSLTKKSRKPTVKPQSKNTKRGNL